MPGHIETSGHGRVGASAGDGQDPADVLVREEGVPEVHEEGGDAARVPLPGVAQFRIDVRVEEELGHREANRGGRGLVHRPQFGEGRLRLSAALGLVFGPGLPGRFLRPLFRLEPGSLFGFSLAMHRQLQPQEKRR